MLSDAVDPLNAVASIIEPPLEPTASGTLDGLAVAVKDSIALGGRPTRAGRPPSSALEPAPRDAEVVRRLRSAGARIVATTTMPELASAGVTWTAHQDHCRNPWDPTRTAGGSSGGAAVVVATGRVPVSIGTDTAGSVLMPAALNGVLGLRPTHGRVPVDGVMPLSPTLDTVGIFAASVPLLAESFAAIADDAPATPPDAAELRLGILQGPYAQWPDPSVAEAVGAAIDALGARTGGVQAVRWPSAADIGAQARTIYLAEAARSLRRHGGDQPGAAATVTARIDAGAAITDAQLAAAHRARVRWRGEVAASFAAVDVLAAPTVPVVAPPIGGDPDAGTARLVALTYPVCLAGTPAISLPAGQVGGLPVGLMLVAPWGEERRLLALAAAAR
jgi:aspartyl-tRNA(Asn)/glutamyl-tRNA(Gln) amidotransferase subunit A